MLLGSVDISSNDSPPSEGAAAAAAADGVVLSNLAPDVPSIAAGDYLSGSQRLGGRRTPHTCPLRSDCRREADRRFVEDLFATDWEAFVIRHDPAEDRYLAFTICCESAAAAGSAPGAKQHGCV